MPRLWSGSQTAGHLPTFRDARHVLNQMTTLSHALAKALGARPGASPETLRIPLCVPRWDESEALDAGALADPEMGLFALSDQYLDPLWKWLPRMYNPDAPKPILVPEMLPVTTWEQNIRHLQGPDAWDRMRKHAYRAAGFRCEICGAGGKLEAHESWELVNETCVQRLKGILALCPLCHKSHHLGIARRLGMLSDVRQHLMRVNQWSANELEEQIQEAYEVWEQRCEWPWQVDLRWLQDSGYCYV